MCCLNYKGKEMQGRELKLHSGLTADKKLRKVRWSPLKLVKKVTARFTLPPLPVPLQSLRTHNVLLQAT